MPRLDDRSSTTGRPGHQTRHPPAARAARAARSLPAVGITAVAIVMVAVAVVVLASCGGAAEPPPDAGRSTGSTGSTGSEPNDMPYRLEGYGLEDAHIEGWDGDTDVTQLPSGQPGELISTASVDAPDGIRAWRMLYHSRGPRNDDAIVTGLVLAPEADQPVPAGGRKIVAFGHGTTGINDACAPSRSQPPLFGVAGTFPLVQSGHIVAATDYIGLGGPGEHPIYVAEDAGRAMLDAARAAGDLLDVAAGRDVVAWGYSQGGQAALAAGAIAASYAPDLRIRGIVASAPLADLPASLRGLEAAPDGSAYQLLAAVGLAAADPSVRLDPILTSTGQRLLALARTNCVLDLLRASNGETNDRVFTTDPIMTEPFASGFTRQRDLILAPMPPVLVLQGDLDAVIHRSITDGVVAGLCAAGTRVDYRRYALADHGTLLTASSADLERWIADRFLASPPPLNDICSFGATDRTILANGMN